MMPKICFFFMFLMIPLLFTAAQDWVDAGNNAVLSDVDRFSDSLPGDTEKTVNRDKPELFTESMSLPISAGSSTSTELTKEVLQGYLGLKPHQLINLLESPDEVLSVRGEKAEEDNVIFYYNNRNMYFFFFGNRVWQIRLDQRFTKSFFKELKMGMSRNEVAAVMGEPIAHEQSFQVYKSENNDFPVRIMIYFEKDNLIDFYFYRSDW